MTIKGAHLVGSVPLNNATEVFELTSTILGDHIKRIPDGETGERDHWIRWQYSQFVENPALVLLDEDIGYGSESQPMLRLKGFRLCSTS